MKGALQNLKSLISLLIDGESSRKSPPALRICVRIHDVFRRFARTAQAGPVFQISSDLVASVQNNRFVVVPRDFGISSDL